MAILEKGGAKRPKRFVKPQSYIRGLLSKVADEFAGSADAPGSDDEEWTDAAIAQSDIAPGDVIVIFNILPKVRTFGGGAHGLDPRQQAKVLRIRESAAFDGGGRIKRDFDDATFVGSQDWDL